MWLLSTLSALVPTVLEKLLPVRQSQFLCDFQQDLVGLTDDDDVGHVWKPEATTGYSSHSGEELESESFSTSATKVEGVIEAPQKNAVKKRTRRVRERVEYLKSTQGACQISAIESGNRDIFTASEAVAIFWSFGQLRLRFANPVPLSPSLHRQTFIFP